MCVLCCWVLGRVFFVCFLFLMTPPSVSFFSFFLVSYFSSVFVFVIVVVVVVVFFLFLVAFSFLFSPLFLSAFSVPFFVFLFFFRCFFFFSVSSFCLFFSFSVFSFVWRRQVHRHKSGHDQDGQGAQGRARAVPPRVRHRRGGSVQTAGERAGRGRADARETVRNVIRFSWLVRHR